MNKGRYRGISILLKLRAGQPNSGRKENRSEKVNGRKAGEKTNHNSTAHNTKVIGVEQPKKERLEKARTR